MMASEHDCDDDRKRDEEGGGSVVGNNNADLVTIASTFIDLSRGK